jgi:exopolysaccharide production protein ExoQ
LLSDHDPTLLEVKSDGIQLDSLWSIPMSATLALNPAVATGSHTQDDDPSLFRRARTWWLLLAMFLLAQENGLFTRQDSKYYSVKGNLHYESSSILLLLTIVLWLICAGLMVGYIGPTMRTMFKQKAVLAFPALAMLSLCWSDDPLVTLRKGILLCFVLFFAWFFATYYSPGDQRRLLLATGFIVALASIAMALLLPVYGIATTGEWKGVFGQKNHLGLCMFFTFSGLLFGRVANARGILKLALQALLPIGLILLSQSKTSLILSFVLIAVRVVGPLLLRARKEQLPFLLCSVFFGILIAIFMATVGWGMVLSALGRDTTLSGRTEHWVVLATFVRRHLLLGYGYRAFWTNHGDSMSIFEHVGAAMTGSDSAYVDILLQFGLLGMGLFLVVLLVSARDFLNLVRNPTVPLLAFWYAGLILAVYVGSVTEGLFPNPAGTSTFVFVVACAGLRRLTEQGRSLPQQAYRAFLKRSYA